MKLSRIARSLAVVAGLLVPATLAAAPMAAADVVDVSILPGLGTGPAGVYGAGCTYLVVARTEASAWIPKEQGVSIVDRNRASTFFPQEFAWDYVSPYWVNPVIFGHAVTLWTPTAPGEHSIMAYQTSAGGPEETVTVNPATPLGPVCLVAP